MALETWLSRMSVTSFVRIELFRLVGLTCWAILFILFRNPGGVSMVTIVGFTGVYPLAGLRFFTGVGSSLTGVVQRFNKLAGAKLVTGVASSLTGVVLIV